MVPTRRKNTARPRLGMHGRENAVRFTGGQFPENAERCEADDGSILNPESAAGEKGRKNLAFHRLREVDAHQGSGNPEPAGLGSQENLDWINR